MKKVKVRFKMLATSWGYAYYRGAEVELEPTDQLAGAVACGRVEIIGDAPADFKRKVSDIQEANRKALIIKSK